MLDEMFIKRRVVKEMRIDGDRITFVELYGRMVPTWVAQVQGPLTDEQVKELRDIMSEECPTCGFLDLEVV